MSRPQVRGWWVWSLVAAAGLLAPWPASTIERAYSRTIYPLIEAVLTRVTNVTALAAIDVGLVGLFAWLVWRIASAFSDARNASVWTALGTLAQRVLRAAGVLGVAFLCAWGLNYRRVPLEEQLGGQRGQVIDAGLVRQLAAESARSAAAFRTMRSAPDEPLTLVAARLEAPFQEALRRLGLPPVSVVGRPKHSRILTPFFTAAGVTGMVNPILLESMVHPDLLPFERPMVLAHEWAHLAGLADEADASAVGWLACRLAGRDLAYSADFSMLLEAGAALPRAEWRALRLALPSEVEEDIAALAARVSRAQPQVRQTANRVYDGYLRSNRVEDGVRSYSRVVRVAVSPGMRAALPR